MTPSEQAKKILISIIEEDNFLRPQEREAILNNLNRNFPINLRDIEETLRADLSDENYKSQA